MKVKKEQKEISPYRLIFKSLPLPLVNYNDLQEHMLQPDQKRNKSKGKEIILSTNQSHNGRQTHLASNAPPSVHLCSG